ncbi:MAG: hypothetical protein ACOC8E_06150, partial [Planctomycetota bacterium]
MSDVTYEGYREIVRRVERARRAWGRTHVAESVLKYAAATCGVLIVFSLIGAFGPAIPVLRWLLLAALVGVVVGGAVYFVFKPLFRSWTDEQVAVRVESQFPELDNAIINSLQLARDQSVGERAMVSQVIRQAEQQARRFRFADAIDRRGLKRFGIVAGATAFGLLLYLALLPGTFALGMRRILMPGGYVPGAEPSRTAEIVAVRPGNKTVLVGDPQEIVVEYRRVAEGEIKGTLTCRIGEEEETVEMSRSGDGLFAHPFHEVRAPRTYHVEVGGDTSETYRIEVTPPPAVTDIQVEYVEVPAYIRPRPKPTRTSGNIKAPQGSVVRLSVRANKPIRSGTIQDYGDDIDLVPDSRDPSLLSGLVRVNKSGGYKIKLRDTEGYENRAPAIYRITAAVDQRPVVRITTPTNQRTDAYPGAKVTVAFAAEDDYGIATAELIAWHEGSKSDGIVIKRWDRFTKPRNVKNTYDWLLPKDAYKPGDEITYRVRVVDNRSIPGVGEGQKAQTEPYCIRIVDRTKMAEAKVKNLRGWQERLRKVLEQELDIRKTATRMGQADDAGRLALLAENAARHQVEARHEVMRIANDMKPDEPNLRTIKARLDMLAANEMGNAVAYAERMARAKALDEAAAELKPFTKSVDETIRVLRDILKVLPRLEEQARKQKDEDEGFDLSEGTKEKLKDLKRGLQDFIEDQKEVIDAAQELAQRDVDDFTKEDDRKLKALAATEDKWSQFLKEKHFDLSKVPEQDLANSTLCKELLEVQSEVQMAKDALSKKSKEIATAIEDNGLEMAKSLTTHIEKWLPDSPDRQKWQMEEMPGDAEAPMAELPKELEDLVGDLMEQEEDLMEEVEDSTAGYADSLDKGAGWDAMDGPIDNMSAQGVTGNRLP